MEESILPGHHWTRQRALQRYFLLAAIVACICLLFGLFASVARLDETKIVLPLRITAGLLLGATGAISALFLWLSMWSYWWQVDRHKRGMRIFWMLALSLGNWAGATIYC